MASYFSTMSMGADLFRPLKLRKHEDPPLVQDSLLRDMAENSIVSGVLASPFERDQEDEDVAKLPSRNKVPLVSIIFRALLMTWMRPLSARNQTNH